VRKLTIVATLLFSAACASKKENAVPISTAAVQRRDILVVSLVDGGAQLAGEQPHAVTRATAGLGLGRCGVEVHGTREKDVEHGGRRHDASPDVGKPRPAGRCRCAGRARQVWLLPWGTAVWLRDRM